MGNKSAPEIRFAGFTDAWELRKLGILVQSFEYGLNAAAMEYDGKNKYLRITDINDETHEFKTDVLTSPDVDLATAEKYQLKDGDVLFARTGASVGKTYRYKESDGLVYFAGFLIRARIKPEYDSEFVFQNTLTDKYNRFIKITSQRSGQPGVNAQEYADFEISVPKIDEQREIGMFFEQLDHLITLHQRKLDNVKKLKAGMLQKMLPKNGEFFPEVRFPGFTDAWEQRKWINTVDISTNMVDPKIGKYDNLPHIGPGNIESFSGRLYDNVKSVKDDNLISGKFHFNKGDVIYGKIRPQLGKYVFAPFEGLASADAYVLNAKNGLDQTFLFTLLQTQNFFKYSVSVSMRSGMPKINRNELNEYEFFAPSVQEQKLIGELFLLLDQLITLNQRELNALKGTQKAFLQKMFV